MDPKEEAHLLLTHQQRDYLVIYLADRDSGVAKQLSLLLSNLQTVKVSGGGESKEAPVALESVS